MNCNQKSLKRDASGSSVFRIDYPINQALHNKLDSLIDYDDTHSNSTLFKSNCKSFWICFYKRDSNCFVRLIANFNYYSSKRIDGYFKYRDRIVSIYELNLECASGLVDKNKLYKGAITNLTDYDNTSSRIGPHDPHEIEYKIINKDSLVFNSEE
jgi:hypothetical protein